MAVPTKVAQNRSPIQPTPEWTPVQLKVADLLGQGMSRGEVARQLNGHLLRTNEKRWSERKRQSTAMKRIRQWQRQKTFRDMVWEYTLAHLDSRSSKMVHGVTRRAEAGRVDAAKFGLELAGRYTPKGHDQPTAVQIVVGNVPRPVVEEVVEGSVVAEEEL